MLIQKLLFEFDDGFTYIRNIDKIFGRDNLNDLSDDYYSFIRGKLNSLNTNKLL